MNPLGGCSFLSATATLLRLLDSNLCCCDRELQPWWRLHQLQAEIPPFVLFVNQPFILTTPRGCPDARPGFLPSCWTRQLVKGRVLLRRVLLDVAGLHVDQPTFLLLIQRASFLICWA
ncbi:hypothetical protein LR48_Vigan09g078700 [Vigna angularis]|uniref:Secreted protein n=2 Tax=Phaseolus angularis TaxID=3914 RepID=A0A0L9VAU9_PHAAN|nr:hypothetical protein LR48_Vigan09g078700 [Vigna angularis]BAT88756.1 hypothetical protein VIGAN_05235800 [Vigna angularis var. angularis]